MTPEQKASYVVAMAACATAEIAGMQAANQERLHRGEALAYPEEAFLNVINRYPIHHNAVISLFKD